MSPFWTKALEVGGVVAIAGFVVWALYKKIIGLGIFSPLKEKRTFAFLSLVVVLVFLFAGLIVTGWIITQRLHPPAAAPAAEGVRPPTLVERDGALFVVFTCSPGQDYEAAIVSAEQHLSEWAMPHFRSVLASDGRPRYSDTDILRLIGRREKLVTYGGDPNCFAFKIPLQ